MSKFFLTSKTIIGGLLAAGPAVFDTIGISVPGWGEFSDYLFAMADSLNEMIGLALVIWGRLTATKSLSLIPNKGA